MKIQKKLIEAGYKVDEILLLKNNYSKKTRLI